MENVDHYPIGAYLANRSAASLFFEEINNGSLSAQVYSEPSPASKLELFTKIDNRLKPRTTFTKGSILDFWWGSEYSSSCLKHSDKEDNT